MARISPNPVAQIVDLNGEVIYSLNNSGSTTSVAAAPGIATPVSGPLNKIKVLISSAMLLALKATPQVLVPAPGANGVLMVIAVGFRYLFNTTAYTLNAGTIKLFQGPAANAKPLTASVATGLVDQVANRIIPTQPILAPGSLTDAQGINTDLELANDGAAEMTLGDGTLEVFLEYKIIGLP